MQIRRCDNLCVTHAVREESVRNPKSFEISMLSKYLTVMLLLERGVSAAHALKCSYNVASVAWYSLSLLLLCARREQ